MVKKEKRLDFTGVVKNKKLPILTIDSRWHEIFTDDMKTPAIRELEQEVNRLLKKQGKLVHDIKDMKALKSNLLQGIMENMGPGRDLSGKLKEKKLDQNKQFVKELNGKIEMAMDELSEIPYQIKKVNELLLAESIQVFYQQLEYSKEEIKELNNWIANIRQELKEKILMKQDMEEKNSLIYTYMHDILGAEIMELFDKEQGKNKNN